MQMALEDLIGAMARHSGAAHAVLLCDRGVLDGRAYCSTEQCREPGEGVSEI